MKQKHSLFYFAVNELHIPKSLPLPFDLFINSSILDDHPNFIRIKRIFDIITQEDIDLIKSNYSKIYIAEAHRGSYFQVLTTDREIDEKTKISLFKNFIICYLDKAFKFDNDFALLNETMLNASETLEYLLTLFAKKNIGDATKILAEIPADENYFYDHAVNVSIFSSIFYRHIFPKSPYEEMVSVALAGLFHDIGKAKLLPDLQPKLSKGQLDNEKSKFHPKYGLDIISNIDLSSDEIDLKILKNVIYQHHENCNGTGYPLKLTKDKISPFTKIVTIVDFYDAITTKRNQCETVSIDQALALMEKSANKKIDLEYFNEFKKLFKNVEILQNVKYSLIDEFDPCIPNAQLPTINEILIVDDKINYDDKKIGSKEHIKQFLIIDADDSFLTVLLLFLKKIHINCQITSTNNSQTAINLLRNRTGKFDYLFVDVSMPEFKEMKIAKELSKNHEENINSLIYILGAKGNVNESDSYIAGLITKPTSFYQLETIFYQFKKRD